MAEPTRYESPNRVWVADGHVLLESHNGDTIIMTPEVALELSRILGAAGSDALVNKVTGQR